MGNYKLIFIAIFTSFTFVVILGIANYGYSFKRKKFVHSLPVFIYAIAVATLFSIYYLPQIYNEIINFEDERDISKIYPVLNILSAEVSFMVLFYYHSKIIVFLNKAQIEFILMKEYVQSKVNVLRLSVFGVRALGFPLILCATTTIKHLLYNPLEGESAVNRLKQGYLSIIPYIIRSSSSTLIYGILMFTSFYMKSLIADVQSITKEVNLLNFHRDFRIYKPFHKMQRFCEMSDRLDEILGIYSRIMSITQEYVRFIQIPWIASLGCNTFGVTYGIFAQYTYIVNTTFDGNDYDIVSAFSGAIFILVSAIDIFLQAQAVTENTELVIKLICFILK